MDIDVDKEMNLLLNNLNDVLDDERFKSEFNTVKNIIEEVKQIDINNLNLVLLDKIKEEILMLEEKNSDIYIYELYYVYGPLYIYFEKVIHKNEISKLRFEMRKKRGERNGKF